MKKIFIYIIGIISVIGIHSCNSLNLSPIDYFGSGNYWQNEAQVSSFMIGLHSQLRNQYQYLFLLGEARGETLKNGTSSQNTSLDYSSPIKNNAFTNASTGVTNWCGFYGPILDVNLFISEVENNCNFLPAADKNYFLGQAYGLRAFYYFLLYRTYGGVPIITDPKVMNGVTNAKDLYVKRNTAKETMDFIKSDIDKSIADFGTNTTINGNKSQWSLDASLMLKGEVYLWSGKVATDDQKPAANNADIQTAKTALLSITGFSLLPNFKNVIPQKGNNEIIFALRFADGEASNWANLFLYQDAVFINQVYGRNGKLISNDTLNLKSTGLQRHEYKNEFWQSYDSTDTRRDVTFLEYYNKSGQLIGSVMKKFIGIINSTNNRVYVDDIPVFRYAETLLMLAECENMLGNDPSPYINQIRQRAYGANWDPAKYGYTNQGFAQNELAILHEYDKEFVGEGQRWFDVYRMHDAGGNSLAFSSSANYPATSPILQSSESYMLLWPIDVNTLNGNPLLVQNPGY